MRFQFIENYRDEFPVKLMCKVLEVSTSGYYAWRGRPPSEREMANRALTARIKEEFEKSGETYGSPRIYQVRKNAQIQVDNQAQQGRPSSAEHPET